MTDTPSPAGHQQMRIGDADRARLADLLDDAFADGRLEAAEHQERMAGALDARTVADIAPLVRDLGPVESIVPAMDQVELGWRPGAASSPSTNLPARQPQSSPPPIVAGQQYDRIVTFMGDTVRGAGQTLAVRTEISSGMGDVKIDLTSMAMAAHDVVIHINSGLGDVRILVPDGVRVIDQTSHFLGDSKITGMTPVAPDAPSITLTGFMALGDLQVYGPQHKSFGKKLRRWFGHS